MDPIFDLLEHAAEFIDLIGIVIVLYGFVISLIKLLRMEAGRWLGRNGGIVECEHVRLELGTYILLGIEFMIASDIINTVISRTIDSLIFVAALVVIRTAISFFLGRELAELERIGAKKAET